MQMTVVQVSIKESAQSVIKLSHIIAENPLATRSDALAVESTLASMEQDVANMRRQLRVVKSNLFALKQGESK